MNSLINPRGLLPLALLSLTLGACTDKDSKKDETDTDVTVDTAGDTSTVDDGFFHPVRAAMSADLAYDADGLLGSYSVDGTEIPSTFTITYQNDAGDLCPMEYEINLAAFNALFVDEGGDTDVPDTDVPDTDVPDTDVPDTDVTDTDIVLLTSGLGADATGYLAWLDSQSLIGGTIVKTGLYTARIATGCNLDPAEFSDKPADAFLRGVWRIGFADGLPAGVKSDLDDNGGLDGFYGAGFDIVNALGGYTQVPTGFFSDNSHNNLETAGLAGRLTETMEVEDDGSGNLTLVKAADVSVDGHPSSVVVRLQSLYVITFSQ